MKRPVIIALLVVTTLLVGCQNMTPETQQILARGAVDSVSLYFQGRKEVRAQK